MWVTIYTFAYLYIYAYVYVYLDIYVGRFWKFHSNVICIELMACNKAGVDRNEYKLHCTFFPSTLSIFFTCITDIGAHKPWLVAPFTMHDFPMYYIPNVTKNSSYVCLLCCIYMYCMAIKLIHCHSLSLSMFIATLMRIYQLYNGRNMKTGFLMNRLCIVHILI